MRLQSIKLKYWLIAAIAAAPIALGLFALQPSAALTGLSLEAAGYSLSSLESARFDNPCPEHAEYPLDFYIAEGDHMRRYAEHLAGSYTVIYVPMPFYDTAELVPLMWLQVVYVDDISGLSPTLETKNGPVLLRQLSKRRVYRDKNIVVFDVTALERSEDIETVTQHFAAVYIRQSQAFIDAKDNRPPDRGTTPSLPMLSMLNGTYRFDVITDMHRYLQENLSQSILPSDAA